VTTVLITRPLEASLQLANLLDPCGIHPIVMPLYTFLPRDPGLDMHKALAGLESRKLAVFTSPRAVQFGLEHIPPDLQGKLEFAAVGPATRALLETAGHQVGVQARGGFTAEDLLQVPELAAAPGEAVIFCAPAGRTKLARGLRDLGWTVSMAMVYQRQPQRPAQHLIDELIGAQGLLSVWTSVSALELAREYLPAAAWSKILNAPALVISTRIKHHLQQAGATRVALAEEPGNTGLFQLIQAESSNKRTASN
jgi:uroporphyrinogen-III synthase